LIESYFQELLDRGATELRLDMKDISGSGTLAYESGTFSFKVRPAEGTEGEASNERGKYVMVLQRSNGTWRVENMVWNSDLPVPTAPAASAR
jgi:ketosteroid isomerase-like protein